MRYLKLLLSLQFLFVASLLQAHEFTVTLNGFFPGAEGQEVRIMHYADQLSFREQNIGQVTINAEGRFSFTFRSFHPQYIFFRIDHARMGMLVEPGHAYELEFDPVDFALLDDRRNPYLDPWEFPFRVSEHHDGILNQQIDQFNELFDDFLLENFPGMYRTRNHRIFDQFRARTDSLFGKIENPFFQDYYTYKFASYYRIANTRTFENLAREYLINKPVLYHNPQYMNFFGMLFDTYVFAGSRRITLTDLRHTVNDLNSYSALMDSLGKDTILHNEVIREMVMLKALQDMYFNPDYRKENVVNILTQVAEKSKFPEHRSIAANILYEQEYLKPGTPAPTIRLKTSQGVKNIPDDFAGKYVYLVFWATWCDACLAEFPVMAELYKKYSKNFVFVSISTDRHIPAYQAFNRQNSYKWYQGHFERDFAMLDQYHIRTLPSFVLIDPEGRIAEYPAAKPSENIVRTFDWLLFQQRQPQRRR